MKKREDRLIRGVGHITLSFMSVCALVPLWLLFASSFSDEQYALRNGYKFFPKELSLGAYEYIIREWDRIGRAYGITILVAVIGTLAGVMITAMLAYGLSQRDVRGTKVIFVMVIITMLFNGGIVPTYYIYTNVLNIKNTLLGLILPNLLTNAFLVTLMKNYFEHNIPKELMESAEIDGAGQLLIFFRMVLPLSKPILATVGLLNAVAYWNDWTNGLYYISDERLFSIQQMLNRISENISFLAANAAKLGQFNIADLPGTTVRMAIAGVAIFPMLLIYPFFQSYFAKGITLGAVKG